MPELSNLLRQRLAAAAEPRVHPDADTLTAYTERLLAARERRQVLEHLAMCGPCRDVISILSMAQAAPGEPRMLPSRLRRSWRSWKLSWGLGASLAGLALVATLIIEMPHGTAPTQNKAFNPAPVSSPTVPVANEEPAAQTTANGSTDTPNPPAGQSLSRHREQDSLRPSRVAAATPGAPAKASAPVAGPYINVEMFASEANYAMPPVDLPSAPAPRLGNPGQNNLSLANSAPLAAAPAPYEISSGKPLRIITPNSSTTHLFGWSIVNNAKKQLLHNRPPAALGMYGFTDRAMVNPAKELGPSEEAAPTRLLDSKEAGELARSGAFTARALGSSGFTFSGSPGAEARVAGFQLGWKVAEGKLLRLGPSGSWTEPYPSGDGIEFSVVSSHGSDVWAGGGNAALVHSRDGGATWKRLTLGASATGTIHSIEASGLTIVVKSSSGQSWTSADGGETWSLLD
jgi:hypothetical protein